MSGASAQAPASLVRGKMIFVTKLNGKDLVINADLIESMEATPDVVISLTTGNKIVVQETLHDLVNRIVEYKSRVNDRLLRTLRGREEKGEKDEERVPEGH